MHIRKFIAENYVKFCASQAQSQGSLVTNKSRKWAILNKKILATKKFNFLLRPSPSFEKKSLFPSLVPPEEAGYSPVRVNYSTAQIIWPWLICTHRIIHTIVNRTIACFPTNSIYLNCHILLNSHNIFAYFCANYPASTVFWVLRQ